MIMLLNFWNFLKTKNVHFLVQVKCAWHIIPEYNNGKDMQQRHKTGFKESVHVLFQDAENKTRVYTVF